MLGEPTDDRIAGLDGNHRRSVSASASAVAVRRP